LYNSKQLESTFYLVAARKSYHNTT